MAGSTIISRTADFLNNLFEPLLTKIAVTTIILLAGFILARIVGKFIERLLAEVELNNIIRKATDTKTRAEEWISSIITYLIYFITIIMALAQLGVETYIIYLISAAIILIIVISVFLGIKDFVPNLVAGFFIYRKGFLNEGDFIEYKSIKGKVIKITLVETRIETKGNDIIYIPNSLLAKSEFKKLKKL